MTRPRTLAWFAATRKGPELIEVAVLDGDPVGAEDPDGIGVRMCWPENRGPGW